VREEKGVAVSDVEKCPLCGFPRWLFQFDPSIAFDGENWMINMVELTGPSTHPDVFYWCDGADWITWPS